MDFGVTFRRKPIRALRVVGASEIGRDKMSKKSAKKKFIGDKKESYLLLFFEKSRVLIKKHGICRRGENVTAAR